MPIPKVISQLVGKAIAAGAVASLTAAASAIAAYASVEGSLPLSLVLLAAACGFWKEGIVPAVEGFFKEHGVSGKKAEKSILELF